MEQNINGNADLFRLYRNLVEPFREYEKRTYCKRELEQKAESAKSIIGYGFKKVIREAFWHTLKWAIPFLIIFYVIANNVHVNGSKLYYYYTDLCESMVIYSDNIIILLLECLFFWVPFPCLIFLFPFMIVRNMISRLCRISRVKKTLKTCEEQLAQEEAAVQEVWKGIAPYIGKVPSGYRNSRALAFFSDSFFNSKVKNVTEAIELYKQHLLVNERIHHAMQMALIEENEKQKRQRALENISRQLDHIQDQLDSQEPIVNNYYYY